MRLLACSGQSEAAVAAWVRLERLRTVSRVIVVDDTGTNFRHLPSTLSLTIAAARDIDGDARPDFLLAFTSGEAVVEMGLSGADTLELAAHSLPNGKVSVKDAQAKQYAASRCPEVKLNLVADEVSLLCAKLRGASRDAALAAFRANCAGERYNGCSIDPDFVWDNFRPPFTL